MKILVIALSGIGDALMFTPSLKKLNEDFSSAEVDILSMYKGVKEIYEKLPGVNKVLYHDFLNSPRIDSLTFVLKLRNKYDITINVYPSNRKEYNLISYLIGAERRASINYLRKGKSNLSFLNNVLITENDKLHNVEENILLCERLSGIKSDSISPLQIVLSQEEINFAEDFLSKNSINDELVIGFHPGCSPLKNHEKRRWETEKFALLAQKLIDSYSAKILVFGGPEEEPIKEKIVRLTNSKNILTVKANSILQTAAVMNRCNLFITNDSSLMHIAAALKLNTVVILGPTNKNYIYPWKTEFKIASLALDCSPCFYYSPKHLSCSRSDVKFKCIKELDVNLVYDKAAEFLNNS
ncbi:MAG: glycosyltransferase family 9 protein [Melioribacter sp.]|nr:glycosyltransferase family 9 protein [Melioribacter sp.]